MPAHPDSWRSSSPDPDAPWPHNGVTIGPDPDGDNAPHPNVSSRKPPHVEPPNVGPRDPRGWAPSGQQYPAPRPRRSLSSWLLRIALGLVALVAVIGLLAVACAPDTPAPPPAPTSGPAGGTLAPIPPDPNAGSGVDEDGPAPAVMAELSVQGTGKATVTYGNDTGGTNQETVTLPWRTTVPDGSLITLSGMSLSGKSTKITCTIGRPGIDPVSSTSNGAYAACNTVGGF